MSFGALASVPSLAAVDGQRSIANSRMRELIEPGVQYRLYHSPVTTVLVIRTTIYM